MSGDIWNDDLLNRNQDAQLILQDLFHRNVLAVKRNSGAVSTNVDAAWGMGKTFFIKRFRDQLEADGYKTVYIDAWHDDNADDPLNAIMSPMLDAVTTSKVTNKLKKNLKGAAGSILLRSVKGLATTGAGLLIGRENVEGIADDVVRLLSDATAAEAGQIADAASDEFKRSKETISSFKKSFSEALDTLTNRPLFVFIDELDRCRPTYAVRLLERVKHLFDIPNIAFVFSTNTDQLTHTIRAVYGDSFDAVTYLRRFFDRTYQLEALSNLSFIKMLWERYALSSARFSPTPNIDPTSLVDDYAQAFGLSLRDLEQCHEILFTVEANSNKKVTIPLGFVLVLIILFQQGHYSSFEQLQTKGVQLFNSLPRYVQNGVANRALIFARWHSADGTQQEGSISIHHLFDAYGVVAHANLDDNDNRQATNVGQVLAEKYRAEEYFALHKNMHDIQKPPKSILLQYFGAIKRAAKFV